MVGKDKQMSLLAPMSNDKHNAKKKRARDLVPMMNQEPRQEAGEDLEEGELAHGEEPGALVSLVPGRLSQIDVRVDMMLFHCEACHLPLKPPVFKCASGHMVCRYCRRGHSKVCGHVDMHCGDMDVLICASKIPCSYRDYGCNRYIVYHEAEAHMRACHCAPCACPDPDCRFLGAPAVLLDHFTTGHSWPIIVIRYGWSCDLNLPLSKSRHAIVGKEDHTIFLVTLGKLGGAAITVSLVCVRANDTATTTPKFRCKLSVEHPGGDKGKVVLMASAVSSSAMFGGAPTRPGQGMFLAVPHELIYGEMLSISVQIDQVPSIAPSTTTKKIPLPTF